MAQLPIKQKKIKERPIYLHTLFGESKRKEKLHIILQVKCYLIEAAEGCTEALAIFVVCQTPGHAIEKKSNRRGNVLSEWLDILLAPPSMPQQSLQS